jgi:uncharacterized membrane protein YeiH
VVPDAAGSSADRAERTSLQMRAGHARLTVVGVGTGAEEIVTIPVTVDLVAVGLGAVSGALVTVRNRFDVSGAVVLAIVTGLGGGLIRDTLLQRGTPVALTSPWLLPTAVVVGLVTFTFARSVDALHRRANRAVLVVDALFLAVYAIVGTAKGLEAGLPGASCVLLGVVTGVGGGLLRDVIVNEQPEMLRPGALLTIAAAIGCTVTVLLVRVFQLSSGVGATGIAVVVFLRLLSVWRGWETPAVDDVWKRRQLRIRRRPPTPPR